MNLMQFKKVCNQSLKKQIQQLIIILKQIPHFFGYDSNPEGDFAFKQVDGNNTFSEIALMFENISPGATLIAFIGLGILLLWSQVLSKQGKIFTLIQCDFIEAFLEQRSVGW